MVDIEEIVEIKCKDFHLVNEIMIESKLMQDQLFDSQNAIEFIKDKMNRNKTKIFVKFDNDQVVGFILLFYKVNPLCVNSYNWHISYLYVKPTFRRKHIAKAILQKCIDYAMETKVGHISLNTDTQNFAAHSLYESLGFKKKVFIANYFYYEFQLK